jgi:hypothetical protein
LIRDYYACFNERRFADGAALFTDDAIVDQIPFRTRERGGASYLLFANTWTTAFPDATVQLRAIRQAHPQAYEVDLSATGTHLGELALGGCYFKPTGVRVTMDLREILEVAGGRIVGACLSFDFQELAHQLARVDEGVLLTHLERIRMLDTQLRTSPADETVRRALLECIGHELDAARRTIRPYFKR